MYLEKNTIYQIPYGKLVIHMTMCHIVFHILHDHVPYGKLVTHMTM